MINVFFSLSLYETCNKIKNSILYLHRNQYWNLIRKWITLASFDWAASLEQTNSIKWYCLSAAAWRIQPFYFITTWFHRPWGFLASDGPREDSGCRLLCEYHDARTKTGLTLEWYRFYNMSSQRWGSNLQINMKQEALKCEFSHKKVKY